MSNKDSDALFSTKHETGIKTLKEWCEKNPQVFTATVDREEHLRNHRCISNLNTINCCLVCGQHYFIQRQLTATLPSDSFTHVLGWYNFGFRPR